MFGLEREEMTGYFITFAKEMTGYFIPSAQEALLMR
jgi:hypothetical protein